MSHASGTPGGLVLADAFYPGWTASAAGKSLPVYAVDGLFRGVNVGSGPREVHFSYRPASFRLGAIISALSLMLILLATYWPRPKPASAWPH